MRSVRAQSDAQVGGKMGAKKKTKRGKSPATKRISSSGKKRGHSLWWITGLLLMSSVGLGFAVGRAHSPDYSDPREAREAIAEWILERTTVEGTRWSLEGSLQAPGVAILRLTHGDVSFRCGAISYPESSATSNKEGDPALSCPEPADSPKDQNRANSMSSASDQDDPNKVIRETLDDRVRRLFAHDYSREVSRLPELLRHRWSVEDAPNEGLTFKESLEVLVGESAGVGKTLLDARKYWLERRSRRWTAKLRDGAILVASAVTGYALGYYWGYRNNPNCATPTLQQQLKSVELWEQIRAEISQIYTLRMTIGMAGVIQKIESPQLGEVNLRDVYLPLRAARLIDCGSGNIRISDTLYEELKQHSHELFKHADAPIWVRLTDLVRSRFWRSPVMYDWMEDARYYGLRWWQQRPDHTWEPVSAEVSSLMSAR